MRRSFRPQGTRENFIFSPDVEREVYEEGVPWYSRHRGTVDTEVESRLVCHPRVMEKW